MLQIPRDVAEASLRPITDESRKLAEEVVREYRRAGKEGLSTFLEHDASVATLDRDYAILRLDGLTADIWLEDDLDVCVQILPPSSRTLFPDFELFRSQVDRVFGKVFSGLSDLRVDADIFGAFRYPGEPMVPRRSTVGTLAPESGRDMLSLRFWRLLQRPGGVKFVVAAVKELDDVLTGRRPPVTG